MKATEKQQQLRHGLALFNHIREQVSTDMPLGQLQVLFALAVDGGSLYMSDIARATGLNKSSLQRHTAGLSDLSWTKKPGLGLVRIDVDPMDSRTKTVTLTSKGKLVIDDFARLLLKGKAA